MAEKSSIRFLIIGDLHGVKPNIYFKKDKFDAIIFPGDVCSDKELRVHTNNWVASWGKTKTPYKEFEKYIDKFGRKKYEKLGKNSIIEGRKILKFLDSFNKPIFFIPGNWDQSYGKSNIQDGNEDLSNFYQIKKALDKMYGKTNKELIKGIKNIIDCQFRMHSLEKFNILGYGCTNFSERIRTKKVKNKYHKKIVLRAYNKIFNKLRGEHMKRDKKKPTIFLSHNMPYKSKMDTIRKKGSPVNGQHYGSTISKEFIKKYQPLVCVGGHFHEYFGKEKIGKTTVINAGFGSKVNTLLEIKTGKIKKITFVSKNKKKGINQKVGWK
jgi:Icc-related predicted phosphoesterase